MKQTVSFALGAILLLGTGSAGAEQNSYRVRYDASLFGLPIGRAVFETNFNGSSFAISGNFASAGIARLFDRTDGAVTVTGRIGQNSSQPQSYALNYRSGDKRKRTTVTFSGGTVERTENEPAPEKRGDDWVPVEKEHLSGVADPLSAALLPAADVASVCNRTMRVYDGEIRADLVLSPASAREAFGDMAVTCRAKFVPVAGYRKNHSSIKFLRDKARILVGFNRVEGRDLYSPAQATIATKVGTVHIRAKPI